jgi:hypothetical protein
MEEHLTTADLARAAQTGETAERPERHEEQEGPLLPQDVVQEFRSRWDQIQTGFVDEPREAVRQADELVANAIKRLADSFAEARAGLERQWDRGGDVSTEDLRVGLRRYRTFFQRLLSV